MSEEDEPGAVVMFPDNFSKPVFSHTREAKTVHEGGNLKATVVT